MSALSTNKLGKYVSLTEYDDRSRFVDKKIRSISQTMETTNGLHEHGHFRGDGLEEHGAPLLKKLKVLRERTNERHDTVVVVAKILLQVRDVADDETFQKSATRVFSAQENLQRRTAVVRGDDCSRQTIVSRVSERR